MNHGEFNAVRASVSESRIYGWLQRASRARASLDSSQLVSPIRASVAGFRTGSPTARVRWVAITITCATVAHVLIGLVVPAYVAQSLPTVAAVVAGLVATIVAAAPGTFARAWRDSSLADWWRRALM